MSVHDFQFYLKARFGRHLLKVFPQPLSSQNMIKCGMGEKSKKKKVIYQQKSKKENRINYPVLKDTKLKTVENVLCDMTT